MYNLTKKQIDRHLCNSQKYAVLTRDKSPFTNTYSSPAREYRDTVVHAWKSQSPIPKLPVQLL